MLQRIWFVSGHPLGQCQNSTKCRGKPAAYNLRRGVDFRVAPRPTPSFSAVTRALRTRARTRERAARVQKLYLDVRDGMGAVGAFHWRQLRRPPYASLPDDRTAERPIGLDSFVRPHSGALAPLW